MTYIAMLVLVIVAIVALYGFGIIVKEIITSYKARQEEAAAQKLADSIAWAVICEEAKAASAARLDAKIEETRAVIERASAGVKESTERYSAQMEAIRTRMENEAREYAREKAAYDAFKGNNYVQYDNDVARM